MLVRSNLPTLSSRSNELTSANLNLFSCSVNPRHHSTLLSFKHSHLQLNSARQSLIPNLFKIIPGASFHKIRRNEGGDEERGESNVKLLFTQEKKLSIEISRNKHLSAYTTLSTFELSPASSPSLQTFT